MNLKSIFKYRISALAFLLVVSYSIYKLNSLGMSDFVISWLRGLNNVAIGIFLVGAIYIHQKSHNFSFIKMIVTNLGFILVSILLAAAIYLLFVNLLFMEVSEDWLSSALESIGGGMPLVLLETVSKTIALISLGIITSIVVYFITKKGNTLHENLLDDGIIKTRRPE